MKREIAEDTSKADFKVDPFVISNEVCRQIIPILSLVVV